MFTLTDKSGKETDWNKLIPDNSKRAIINGKIAIIGRTVVTGQFIMVYGNKRLMDKLDNQYYYGNLQGYGKMNTFCLM